MQINRYIDSTYLKKPEQSGFSEEETLQKVISLAQEAIDHHIFAVMIRPDYVKQVKSFLQEKEANVAVGTVIGFHEGTYSIDEKLKEAQTAIQNGADELDFVINYEAYKQGNIDWVKEEFLTCTQLCYEHNKVAKWIIEIATLSDAQIIDLTGKLAQWAEANFSEDYLRCIFVKSSTGFFETEPGKPNGATFEGIQLMLNRAGKLSVKAAGGVRTSEEAERMIAMGVKRIGTSSALSLLNNQDSISPY